MDNRTLARTWLDVYKHGAPEREAPAAIYFDSNNTPTVIYREGRTIPLLASPFAEDLGECLVYLDEAHTRLEDFKRSKRSTDP
jgi:hypothetical protein